MNRHRKAKISKLPRKVAKREISLLNEELENYFANTIIPQLYIDGDFILRKFTPPAMTHFSLTEADLGRNIDDIKENIRYPTLVENITEVIVTSEILEKEIQTTDGKWYKMNILPYIVRKKNRSNGVIITFVDITKQISTVKELEKLNSDHDTLMFAISHDIRQPLSAIVLLADALREAHIKKNNEQFDKWIETLKRTSNTMKELINDFTEGHKTEITTPEERVNIENIFQDVKLALQEEIYRNRIAITTNFGTSEIIFSRNNLRSILYNLLSNAIKFRRPDKTLEISVSTEKSEGFVILRVKDNGMGIADNHLEKIFQKSERLNSEIDGTGMGLYILKRMVVNQGGKIEVKSVLGKGSTFLVYFKSEYEGEAISNQ